MKIIGSGLEYIVGIEQRKFCVDIVEGIYFFFEFFGFNY